jgi:2-dehydropantoate 2-reductase
LKALKAKGLKILSTEGDFEVNPIKVTDDIKEIGDAELVIMGTKAWQVKDIAAKIKTVNNECIVLPLQNGVLAYDEISSELGKNRVLGGLCRIFSKIQEPGVIKHTGAEASLVFGEMDNSRTKRTEKYLEIFKKSGIKARISDDIQVELWKKFINICASGLLAVSRSTYGEIRQLKETREMMVELFEEIYAISRRMGIHVEHEFIQKTVAFIDTFPFDATSSLTRDVWEGKPSEIEYQNGTVVRLGEKYGVSTPVNRYIYNCILPMELRARRTASEMHFSQTSSLSRFS